MTTDAAAQGDTTTTGTDGAAGAADGAAADAGKTGASSPGQAGAAADAGKGGAAGAADQGKQADAGKAADGDKGNDASKQADAAQTVDYAKAISEVAMPEGVTLDPERAKAGADVFAKHKLSSEAVKDLVSIYAQQQKAGAEGNAKAFSDAVSGWRTEAEKNTSAEERADSKAVALAVLGKDEVALLDHFGVTNRAGFIKAMAKLAPAIKDDKLVLGNAAAPSGSDARKQFPNSNMNP